MDSQERFHQIRDDLDRQAQRFEGAAAKQTSHEAADDSGSDEVRVGTDGALEHLAVRESWRAEYEAEELGAAVVKAYAAAGAKGLEAWSAAMESEDQDQQLRPAPAPHETVAGQLAQIMESAAADGEALTTSF